MNESIEISLEHVKQLKVPYTGWMTVVCVPYTGWMTVPYTGWMFPKVPFPTRDGCSLKFPTRDG